MPTKDDLIEQRKKELLDLGYKPGIVEKAMQWAEGCAEGMARYALGTKGSRTIKSQTVVQFLPQYLNDCETWMRSFGHERGEVKPPE
jgi:hypothetical protein